MTICAVGRLRRAPERELVDDYLERFDRLGRGLSLGPARMAEVEDRLGGGMAGEAEKLDRACPEGALRVALDERGSTMTSVDFAARLGIWRDEGTADLAFLIGGADGLDPGLRAGCDMVISFGAMVWPHMLARAMLAEQLYRGASILAGAPYHRA